MSDHHVPDGLWLSTSQVCPYLGLSGDTLRRYARGGLLELGTHYRPGATVRSPWCWNLAAVRERLAELASERIQQPES